MRKVGLGLIVIGLIGLIYFGYEAMQASENFSVLGVDVAVSSADWTPVIFSGIVVIVGVILALIRKKG